MNNLDIKKPVKLFKKDPAGVAMRMPDQVAEFLGWRPGDKIKLDIDLSENKLIAKKYEKD